MFDVYRFIDLESFDMTGNFLLRYKNVSLWQDRRGVLRVH